MAMASYFTRGALMSEELCSRAYVLDQACGRLRRELAHEEEARELAEKRVAFLEAEMGKIDAKWEAELEKKQTTISTIQTHCAKQSATIVKMREEVAKDKAGVESLRKDSAELRERVASLERGLEEEKRARLSAEENARSSQHDLQNLKVKLDASRAAHQRALANARAIEGRLDFVTSEAGRKEVIESYCQGPIGKLEVTLAVKAGFDHLKAQIPFDAIPPPGPVYPSRVQSCLETLLWLEQKGARVRLDEGADDEDEDEDEDDGSDGEGSN